MAELRTEEEQLEAIKRWWKENGTSLLAGAVLAAAGVFGAMRGNRFGVGGGARRGLLDRRFRGLKHRRVNGRESGRDEQVGHQESGDALHD